MRPGPDLEPVPTVRELAKRGLAVDASGGAGSYFKIKPEGQRLIYDAMARNAERFRQWSQGVRTDSANDDVAVTE